MHEGLDFFDRTSLQITVSGNGEQDEAARTMIDCCWRNASLE